MQRQRSTNLPPARLRAAAPRMPRGSSSLLRLSAAVSSRLPNSAAVGRWLDRAVRTWHADAALA